MKDPSHATLRGLYRLLAAMKSARVRPEELDQALTALRDEGHIPAKPKKRPMGKVKAVERAGDTCSGQGTLQKNPVEAVFGGCEALMHIRDTVQGYAQGDAKHRLGHAERLFLASTLRVLPGGVEAIHRLLSRCPDYDAAITDYHIDSLAYGPLRCETAQENGVCRYQEPCSAMGTLGGKVSPVAFAYHRSDRKSHKRGLEELTSKPVDELMKIVRGRR